ncbi:MAG: hypothetical protein HKP52_01430 [Desulfofustis sp.]|nr:hypothetical protein [Desulfofustis sp.]NNK12877.1 hypothetical protein [Desulfofustis sp.]
MTQKLNDAYVAVSGNDFNTDFEYNFDLNPFNYLLEGIHLLVSVPFKFAAGLTKKASAGLHRIQEKQSYRKTFKGPVCMLK